MSIVWACACGGGSGGDPDLNELFGGGGTSGGSDASVVTNRDAGPSPFDGGSNPRIDAGGPTDSGGAIKEASVALAIEAIASPATALADGKEKIHVSVTRLLPNGTPVVGANVSITVSGTSNTLTPSSGATDSKGVFGADLTSTEAEAKTITATSDGLTATANVTFKAAQGKLVFTTPPVDVPAGVVIDPAVLVTLLDKDGNPVSGGSTITPVTIALEDNSTYGWLAGQTTVSALGFASFNVSVSEPGTGYHLVATAPGYIGATSPAFNVTAGAWHHVVAGPPGIQEAQSLAIDPNDGTLYMTTSDGLWRSDDDGVTFAPLRRGLLSNSNYTSLWVDPSSSHLYAGGPGGFFVSADRGRSMLNKRQSGATIMRSVRSRPGSVVVGFGNGIYTTPDEGGTWTKATGYPSSQAHALLIDPSDPDIVYAGNQKQLYVSSNSGTSFDPVGPAQALTIVGLEADKSGKLFMGVNYGGVFSSVNGGQDFTPVGTPPTKQLNSLALDPTNSNRIYAGTYEGFLRTSNGGTDWLLTTPGVNKVTFNTVLDPATPSTVYTFDGVTLLKSTDSGATFASPITGTSFVSVRSMVASGTNVYASATGRGIWKSTDSGQTWALASTGLPSLVGVGSLAMDPANSSRLFVTTSQGLYVTTDAAGNWTKATDDLEGYQVGLVAIASGGVMYAASSSSFHKSVDDGAHWTTIYPTYSPQITGLATSPANPDVVYLSTTGALRRSTTGGLATTWSSAITGAAFLNVIIDPADANHVIASAAGTVHYTTNGFTASPGTGTSQTSGVLGAAIALDPSNPLTVYVARDGARAWKSVDGGLTYVPITTGLYDDIATFAVPAGGSGLVYAGTYHSGIFKTTTGGE